MKKKLLALVCVLTCVFGLTACGKEAVTYTEFEQGKIANAEAVANYSLQLVSAIDSSVVADLTSMYKKDEMAAIYADSMYNAFGISVEAELGAFDGLLSTYNQMISDMGGLLTLGGMTSEIVGDDIVVTVTAFGNECDGKIVFTFTNDIFTTFEEGNAVASTSISQKLEEAGTHMGDAGLNTILGMGTVFTVLILISFIIASFNLFNGSKKKEEKKADTNTNAPIEAAEENLADDTELVAVIMAAISAYEGNASTDGFVVRSIKKANRRN